MKTLNNKIEQNIKYIISIFILIQPFLDVISGIQVNILEKYNLLSPITRLSFFIFCLYYIFIINKNKKDKTKCIIVLLYILLFLIINISKKNKSVFMCETTNVLNAYYLPIILITFLNIFENKKIKINLKTLVITYFSYIALIIIPNITNTSFNSYSHSKLGNVGWFLLANTIGNILSILLPFIIIYLIKSKTKIIIKLMLIISILYVFSDIGTKVPILSLIICLIGTLFYITIKWIKEKKKTNLITLTTITIITSIFAVLSIPKTAFYKNLEIHKNYLGLNSYLEVFTDIELIDHFIFSQRLTFIKPIHKNYIEASISQKLIGIGSIKDFQKPTQNTKIIEIDYLDIFYSNGIIGTIIYIYILVPQIIKTFKKTKKFNLINIEYKLSIILILLITLFAGHTLISPAVSIYVALIITLILNGGIHEEIN